MSSLIDFWSQLGPSDRIHPDDRKVWDRLKPGFDCNCLPTPYYGRISNAPVVLLFLSPGLGNNDPTEANEPKAQARYARIRTGMEPLASEEDWPDLWKWWRPRTRVFGMPDELRHRVAIMNISAYKSRVFGDYPALAALPSCRFNLDWAHRVLFPEAEAGKRVVVCLRGARYWGLTTGDRYRGTLFAPSVNRAGHMIAGNGSGRDVVIAAVKAVL